MCVCVQIPVADGGSSAGLEDSDSEDSVFSGLEDSGSDSEEDEEEEDEEGVDAHGGNSQVRESEDTMVCVHSWCNVTLS